MPGVYAPARGDFVWLEFSPQAGHEQAGHRPALVISPEPYNRKTGLALVCPITTQIKGYPFEVLVPQGLKAKGVILSDQIKSLDWKARKASLMGRAPASVIAEVLAKAGTLIS
jgi:mRNA interferase MazF